MIQKIVHQFWMQGFDSLPEKYKANVDSIDVHNPGWAHYKWDERMIQAALYLFDEKYLQKFNSIKLLHQKVDYARYVLLYIYGGVSVDVDAVALKSFDSTPGLASSSFMVSKNSTDKFVNNATIFVSQNNGMMKEWVDSINTDCKFYMTDFNCVLQTTGPYAFSRFVDKHMNDIVVLDHKYFEPCSGSDHSCVVGPDAIIDHQHEKSWLNPLFKSVSESYFRIKPYKNVFIVALVLVFVFFAIKGLKK